MKRTNQLFKSPFAKSYFSLSVKELYDIRSVCLAAVLCAFAIVLKLFDLQLSEIMKVSLSFVPIALCSSLTGPAMAIPCGIVVDVIGYAVHPTGPYFPGYTLSAILTALIFALFLYRANIGFARIALSKLSVNVLVNVLIGSLWRISIQGNFYTYYVIVASVKNAFLFPVEVLILCFIFSALSRPMKAFGAGSAYNGKIEAKHIVILVAAAVLSAASVILFTLYYNDILEYVKGVISHP